VRTGGNLEKVVIADRAHSSEGASSARDVAQRVEHIISALLAGGRGAASIELVAQRMVTSVRTLQRRLRAAGLSYSQVVQRARRTAAQRMLKDRGAGIGEVARALGYSDPAHFTRAFHRWTGSTPRDFRAHARSAAVDKHARRHNP
jgi:AraC-like DNA-binding protein